MRKSHPGLTSVDAYIVSCIPKGIIFKAVFTYIPESCDHPKLKGAIFLAYLGIVHYVTTGSQPVSMVNGV